MKKKILAFAASNSKNSINKRLVKFTLEKLKEFEIDFIDLNNFEMPLFSVDRESETGIPQKAIDFNEKIENADGIIVSYAEHNGNYTVAYKNLYDWNSRYNNKVWKNKIMLIMGSSPGGRGAKSVLELAINNFNRIGSEVTGSFSLPSFNANFLDNEIVDEEKKMEFDVTISRFKNSLMN